MNTAFFKTSMLLVRRANLPAKHLLQVLKARVHTRLARRASLNQSLLLRNGLMKFKSATPATGVPKLNDIVATRQIGNNKHLYKTNSKDILREFPMSVASIVTSKTMSAKRRVSSTTTPSPTASTTTEAQGYSESGRTEKVGGTGGGSFVFSHPDQDGSYITAINVTSGPVGDTATAVRSIQVSWSDGTLSPTQGQAVGTPTTSHSSIGFSAALVRHGKYIDSITGVSCIGELYDTCGGNGGSPSSINWGPDNRLIGIEGSCGTGIDSLVFVYGSPLASN